MVGPLRTPDGSLTLESPRYGETYRSRHGAISEARHVFLSSSGTLDRLASGRRAKVLEIGFGTGLNFLVTAAAAGAAGAPLDYVAAERDPLPLEALVGLRYAELLYPFEGPAHLLDWYAGLGWPVPLGGHTLRFGKTTLTLFVGEASGLVEDMGVGAYGAVYLDPFSPRSNPDAWEEAFLGRLASGLAPGGRLVTYSVSGEVRRRLERAGLDVRKVPGPAGGKRESLVAESRPA